MCGLAGFVGVKEAAKRRLLVVMLGLGIDDRGGDAIGYVTIPDSTSKPAYGRRLGRWAFASTRFVKAAMTGETCLLHARFATLANADAVTAAHPFAVRRRDAEGKQRTVLWGAHNGVCTDAWRSARDHGRKYDVDSREVFELLADGDAKAINALSGWGVLAWIRGDDRHAIRLLRLTDGGALYVVKTACGAVVFGSTKSIVEDALELAEMLPVVSYTTEVGKTHVARATPEGAELYVTDDARLAFQTWSKWKPRAWDDYDTGDPDDTYKPRGEFRQTKDGIWEWIEPGDAPDPSSERIADADLWSADAPDPSSDTLPVADKVSSDGPQDSDWWRAANDAGDFERAAFLRAMAKDGN